MVNTQANKWLYTVQEHVNAHVHSYLNVILYAYACVYLLCFKPNKCILECDDIIFQSNVAKASTCNGIDKR